MSKISFISGHRDLTLEEFILHYIPFINSALKRGDSFVIGDYEGADSYAQYFFGLRGLRADVTIYHMGDKPMNKTCSWFKTKGGFTTDEERDAAMTAISDEDIAWVRPGKEDSGTAINLRRRKRA